MYTHKLPIVLSGCVLGVFVVLIALGLGASRFDEEDVSKKGRVSYVDGRAKKRDSASQVWENAYRNTAVVDGDKVRTYRQSRAELELTGLDILRMAPQTTIDIVQLYEEKKARKREISIDLKEGNIWASVGGEVGEVEFNIATPRAAAAITGTTLRVNVDKDSTTELRVYKGEVTVTNAPHRADLKPQLIESHEVPGPYEIPGPHEVTLEEWFYIVKSMQKLTIASDGRVTQAGTFKTDDPEEQTDWVKWNLERDKQRSESSPTQREL